MYKYKPEHLNKRAYAVSFSALATGMLLIYISRLVKLFPGVLQFFGITLIVASLYTVIRFCLTEMEYAVSDTEFAVTKFTGSRRQQLCCLDLSTAIAVCEDAEYREKYRQNVKLRYECRQNMLARSAYYVCEFNGQLASIRFEPNDAFLAIVREKASNAAGQPTDEYML